MTTKQNNNQTSGDVIQALIGLLIKRSNLMMKIEKDITSLEPYIEKSVRDIFEDCLFKYLREQIMKLNEDLLQLNSLYDNTKSK